MKLSILTSAVLFILVTFSSCSKEAENKVEYEHKCIKVKIIRADCHDNVFQIITPGLNIGDAIWEDRGGSKLNPVRNTYNNVVGGVNFCRILEEKVRARFAKGDEVYIDLTVVDLSTYQENGDCYLCTSVIDDSPKSVIIADNFSIVPCDYSKK